MLIKGRVLRIFPRDTNTDEVISGKYKYDELDLNKLAVHAFESIDPKFYEDARKTGSAILIAESNFGCGSSREQAPQVIKACGISCIIGGSFARIFYRNAFNIGLPLIECKGIALRVKQGDELEVDVDRGVIRNLTRNEVYEFKQIPKFMQELLGAGGLLPYLLEHRGYKM